MLLGRKHLFKLDPARPLTDLQIERICTSSTDGIIIGGTDGITYENTLDLFKRINRYSKEVYQEISHPDAIVPGFDGYLIPFVMNANDPYWLLQIHQKAIQQYGNLIDWDQCQVEGYLVLNEDSKVARVTQSMTGLTQEEILAYVRLADQMLRLPYIYIEYSGRYGDPTLIRKIRGVLRHAALIYGGGIDHIDKAREMSLFADTIIVGNILYEDFEHALETVNVGLLQEPLLD